MIRWKCYRWCFAYTCHNRNTCLTPENQVTVGIEIVIPNDCSYLLQTYHIRTSKFDFEILHLHGELQISILPDWFIRRRHRCRLTLFLEKYSCSFSGIHPNYKFIARTWLLSGGAASRLNFVWSKPSSSNYHEVEILTRFSLLAFEWAHRKCSRTWSSFVTQCVVE